MTLLLRYAQTLKEKRNVVKSLSQRLQNRGFTVTECGYREEPKKVCLGFSLVADNPGVIEEAFDKILPLFWGDHEIVDKKRQIVDFFDDDAFNVNEALDNNPREPY